MDRKNFVNIMDFSNKIFIYCVHLYKHWTGNFAYLFIATLPFPFINGSKDCFGSFKVIPAVFELEVLFSLLPLFVLFSALS